MNNLGVIPSEERDLAESHDNFFIVPARDPSFLRMTLNTKL